MKRVLTAYTVAAITLLIFSFAVLYITIFCFPKVAEQYFDPRYSESAKRTALYFLHPIILSIALKYFWQRFKGMFKGNFITRGLEVGLVYALIAVIPAMWITFSGLSISITMVVTWIVYGFLQACIAGIIYARLNP